MAAKLLHWREDPDNPNAIIGRCLLGAGSYIFEARIEGVTGRLKRWKRQMSLNGEDIEELNGYGTELPAAVNTLEHYVYNFLKEINVRWGNLDAQNENIRRDIEKFLPIQSERFYSSFWDPPETTEASESEDGP